MGYGDDEPPSIRADPYAATLSHANQFKMLVLTFVDWDVIKLRWTVNGGSEQYREIDGGPHGSTDYIFEPAQSDGRYVFTAQGCARAGDGSTNYCSPVSDPLTAVAAHNTNSVKGFLKNSGVDVSGPLVLSNAVAPKKLTDGLRALMGL
jgi:hypothetical protein